jgi:spore coat protein CotH
MVAMLRHGSVTFARFAASSGLALVLAGCTGDIIAADNDGGVLCGDENPPAAPTLLDPAPGRIDVTADNFAISTAGFSDPDGDAYAGTQAEIWVVNDDGEPVERVWYARVDGDAPPAAITLDAGTFEGSATIGALAEWQDHSLRVRHLAITAEGCTAGGAWSDDRAFRTDDGSTVIYDDTVIRDFYLDIPAESWGPINAEAYPPGCVPYERNYYNATLRYEDQVFAGVGAKIKGGCGSARDLGGKAGFKINLGWDDPAIAGCPEERRLAGIKKFTLNNMVQDPSLSHERLGYAFYRAMGVPVPRAAPIRLFVNNEFWGVYLDVETVDRRMLSRHFESEKGMLYEGTYWCDLDMGNVGDDDSGCLTREFSADACSPDDPDGDPTNYDPLRAMITELDAIPAGAFYPAVTGVMNFDHFLSMWAVEAILAHWDGYVYDIINNYRVYHDPVTDLWSIIPSGIDQTFQSGGLDPWAVYGKIAGRCIAEPACEAAFAGRLDEALEVFTEMNVAATVSQIQQDMQAILQVTPGREFDLGTFSNLHSQTQTFINDRPAFVRSVMTNHGF